MVKSKGPAKMVPLSESSTYRGFHLSSVNCRTFWNKYDVYVNMKKEQYKKTLNIQEHSIIHNGRINYADRSIIEQRML